MSTETISAILISICIMVIAGLGAYTGQGFFVFIVTGVIIMFFSFRSIYREAVKDDYYNKLKNCHESGWCSRSSDREHIMMWVMLLLVFVFVGATGGGFPAPIVTLILGVEFFILKRHYEKKAKEELNLREELILASLKLNLEQEKFDTLVKRIDNKDSNLGACFERNITFESFENNTLTWSSRADEYDKRILITHWRLISILVKDIFGAETKIRKMNSQKDT